MALKLVRNEKRFHRQAEEEIRILDHLRQQDGDHVHNVIHMLDHFNFRNHKCITFELMSINLYELIKKNKFHGFNLAVSRSRRVHCFSWCASSPTPCCSVWSCCTGIGSSTAT